MKSYKDFSLVTTSNLPSRASEVIIAAAVEQFKEVAKLRQLALVDKVDEGAAVYVYFTYDDLTDAYELQEGADFQYDSASATQSTVDFVKIAKGFQLTWEADHLARLNIRAAQARQAALQVQEKEDDKILEVMTNATTSVTATAAWSETTADPVKDIRSAKTEVRKLGYIADTLLLEPVNAEELMSIIASNTWYGVTEQALKSGNLPSFMGLKIVECPTLSHGTAYVFKAGATGALQIGEAKPLTVHIFDDDDSQSTKVQIYERIAPVLVRPDAVAKIATI